jgi:hypothetical protein
MARRNNLSIGMRYSKIYWLLWCLVIKCCGAFVLPLTLPERRLSIAGDHVFPGATSTQLNGIKGFRIWFENQFPDSIVSINADSSEDTFDHVLMDMNHVIHVILRRSRSEEHAVRLLMSELDGVLKMVVPTKSLVLAVDGAPAAAKLATQRSRRYGTLVRTEWKLEHFDKLRISKSKRARKLRNYNAEIQSLQITPGTEFQDRIESTLLYWAWQRLQHRHSKLRDVRIYISPSTVAGEGEVKILEWILQKPRQGESVAILGRDSDLLLEGLIIPPYWTHNIFIIQADSARRYCSVSLWETTRKLQSWLPPNAPPEQILQLRTDLVLLMMLNGNDYLPKLRGSKGFSNLCQIYKRLLRKEFESGGDEAGRQTPVGFVDPDKLEFRLDFCIRFFQEIAKTSPLANNSTWMDAAEHKQSPLNKLNNIVDGGFVPQPKRFRVIKSRRTRQINDELIDDDELDEEEVDDSAGLLADDDAEDDIDDDTDNDTDDDRTVSDSQQESQGNQKELLVQLSLGDPSSDDFLKYELWHDAEEPLKSTKQKLALMALDDFYGTDLASSEEDYDVLLESSGITSRGYSWEIPQAAPGKADTYLGGLLWNIQTYQDGICADYNYSYGRRTSPTVSDIVDFFKSAKSKGNRVSLHSLLGKQFSPPVSAGLSCLAALPSQVKHLIPEPYSWIADEIVEEFYAQSMDKEDNVFDMKQFEALCEEEIQRIRQERGEIDGPDTDEDDKSSHGRRILSGDHWWTVLSRTDEPLTHPFDPPVPPCKDFSTLFPNPRVRVSRMFAVDAPRPRAAWGDQSKNGGKRHRHADEDIKHFTFGKMLRNNKSTFLDIPYKIDYPMERQRESSQRQKKAAPLPAEAKSIHDVQDLNQRLGEFNKTMPPATPEANKEDLTALYVLTQLHALQFVGPIEFNITSPSTSGYASWNPKNYEHYHLRIPPSKTKTANVLNRTLNFDQDRDLSQQSRQAIKQHLADLALTELLGPEVSWKSLNFADLRWTLQNRNPYSKKVNGESGKAPKVNGSQSEKDKTGKNSGTRYVPLRNAQGLSALECLKQLEDINLVGRVDFVYKDLPKELSTPACSEEVTLVVAPSKNESFLLDHEMALTEERGVFLSRKNARQRLASLALAELTGTELDWSVVPCSDLRAFVMSKASMKKQRKASRKKEKRVEEKE